MAAAKRLVVELYYDVVSPYSYFCFEALSRYRQPWDMDLKLKPFHLGAIMKAANNKPPGMVRSFDSRFLMRDYERWNAVEFPLLRGLVPSPQMCPVLIQD